MIIFTSFLVAGHGVMSPSLWLSDIALCVCSPPVTHYSSVFTHLGFIRVLALGHGAAVNIAVHLSFKILVFCGSVPRTGIAGSYGISLFSFSWPFVLSPLWIYWLSFPPTRRRVLFLYYLSSIYCCRFSMLTILTCVKWCHFWFTVLIFIDAEYLFMCFMAIYVFFGERSI